MIMVKKAFILIIFITIAAFTWEFISLIIYLLIGVLIFWQVASILISVASLLLRFFFIDIEKFSSIITETDLYSKKRLLKSKRFLNLMPTAMVTCTLADIIIPFSFITGMLIFLIAQLLLISAFSGIIHINPKIAFSGKTKYLSIISTIGITVIILNIYLLLLYSSEDFTTILIIPYIVVLTIMVIITFIGLGYNSRSLRFRLILCLGATLFLISDAILAYNRFNIPINYAHLWIGGLYFLAIFFLQFAMLFLNSKIKRIEGD